MEINDEVGECKTNYKHLEKEKIVYCCCVFLTLFPLWMFMNFYANLPTDLLRISKPTPFQHLSRGDTILWTGDTNAILLSVAENQQVHFSSMNILTGHSVSLSKLDKKFSSSIQVTSLVEPVSSTKVQKMMTVNYASLSPNKMWLYWNEFNGSESVDRIERFDPIQTPKGLTKICNGIPVWLPSGAGIASIHKQSQQETIIEFLSLNGKRSRWRIKGKFGDELLGITSDRTLISIESNSYSTDYLNLYYSNFSDILMSESTSKLTKIKQPRGNHVNSIELSSNGQLAIVYRGEFKPDAKPPLKYLYSLFGYKECGMESLWLGKYNSDKLTAHGRIIFNTHKPDSMFMAITNLKWLPNNMELAFVFNGQLYISKIKK